MTLIYFILILGVTVFIHELGHFIFAKKANIYVYEFSIGMGPKLFSFKRKNDETTYAIRLFPIGGFVQMAGESLDDNDVPKDRWLTSKTWNQRFATIIAGILFNFILAFVILFAIGLVNGSPQVKAVIGSVEENSQAAAVGLAKGDVIVGVNNKKIWSVDHFMLELSIKQEDNILLEITNDNLSRTVEIELTEEPIGIMLDGTSSKGILNALSYSFFKIIALVHQMVLVIFYLITGTLTLSSLAGPIGIFNIVGDAAKFGFLNILYLNALISVNVAFINLLPIPAFDGGRLLFLIIEKIKGKPVDPKVENTIHAIGFAFLMVLMIVITFNDVLRLFK